MRVTTALRSTAIQRGLVAIIAAIVVFAARDLLSELLYLLIGVVALAIGLVQSGEWWKTRRWSDLAQAILLLAFGIGLLFGGEPVRRNLQLLLAGILVVSAAAGIYVARQWSTEEAGDLFWPYVKGVLLLALASTLVVIPDTILQLAVIAIGTFWILAGVVVLVNALGEDETNQVPDDLVGVVRSKSMPAPLRKEVTEGIFEGWDTHEGTVRFAALMSFATAIATFGVKSDSTAVVIGAMLIAPLMSPIMALSAATLMGWAKRVRRSAGRVGLGVLLGVGGGFLMSLISPDFIAVTANSEVLSRVSPTLLDLLIALAAGSAGAYALTHPNVSASLPGVAIAVALAPPLAVVGVSLEAGEFTFALGAFLLFLTNLVGIIVAAGFTFILSGYTPLFFIEKSGEQGRRSLALVITSLVLVAVPLAIIGENIIDEISARSRALNVVTEWLGEPTDFGVVRTRVQGSEVEVVIAGPGEPPSVEELASEMAVTLNRSVELELRVIPESDYSASADRFGVEIEEDG